jgi:hypothetical protein
VKTLKDLLQPKEAPVTGQETTIYIETVRVPPVRADVAAALDSLGVSIEKEGLRHPITVWSDGTLVSGARRLRAHFRLAEGQSKSDYRKIRAVFVDNIEDAAKRLLGDNSDEGDAIPLKPSEICRLWDILARLDEPAAARRLDEARRRGVELRKQTQLGVRPPGRSTSRGKGDEYLMTVLAEPFGMAEATASRLRAIHKLANNPSLPDERRTEAANALAALDRGESSIWACYSALLSGRNSPVARVRAAAATEPAPAARQRAAWERGVPQLEGLIAGFTELGPPHRDLGWEQVGPVHARLMKVRRDLEKIINAMKETAQS